MYFSSFLVIQYTLFCNSFLVLVYLFSCSCLLSLLSTFLRSIVLFLFSPHVFFFYYIFLFPIIFLFFQTFKFLISLSFYTLLLFSKYFPSFSCFINSFVFLSKSIIYHVSHFFFPDFPCLLPFSFLPFFSYFFLSPGSLSLPLCSIFHYFFSPSWYFFLSKFFPFYFLTYFFLSSFPNLPSFVIKIKRKEIWHL